VTTPGKDFVPGPERIATFDNDGTLWAEQPMLELLAYLRSNVFNTFIVSGGGIDFMRPWAEEVYGIPPEQVIGSSAKLKFVLRDGQPVLVTLPELNFIDDKAGKPVGIQMHIGRLDKALDEGRAQGWTIVNMKKDWKRVFAFEK
jgi:hypothetical protein